MSQLFFSLSVSMGIMITYGSYVKPEVNLNKAVNQIEIFDTGVALFSRRHDHPGSFCFLRHRRNERRSKFMIHSLPKVFAAMESRYLCWSFVLCTTIFATLTS